MPLPRPAPGMVVRYAFLWSTEAAAGRSEASKDRPCVIVLTAIRQADGRIRVRVLPVTHAAKDPGRGVQIPAKVRRHLGLGTEESWIVLDEANEFLWPGPDLRPVSRERPGVWSFGVLPVELFREVQARLAEVLRQRRLDRDG